LQGLRKAVQRKGQEMLGALVLQKTIVGALIMQDIEKILKGTGPTALSVPREKTEGKMAMNQCKLILDLD
jgi:hypothetical protein